MQVDITPQSSTKGRKERHAKFYDTVQCIVLMKSNGYSGNKVKI